MWKPIGTREEDDTQMVRQSTNVGSDQGGTLACLGSFLDPTTIGPNTKTIPNSAQTTNVTSSSPTVPMTTEAPKQQITEEQKTQLERGHRK